MIIRVIYLEDCYIDTPCATLSIALLQVFFNKLDINEDKRYKHNNNIYIYIY